MLRQLQEHLTDASKPHFNSFFTDTKASKRGGDRHFDRTRKSKASSQNTSVHRYHFSLVGGQ